MGNYITAETSFDEIKRKNFFFYSFIRAFVWMCFHFTLVFFFLLQLESPIIVGIFLALGNLVSFVVDSPVGVIQKYFKSKTLFLFGAILMLIVSAIFLYFIYSTNSITIDESMTTTDFSLIQFQKLFGSVLNIFLLLVSVVFYGIIKELSDVTSLSYIMNNADPSEYADLLSRNNIFFGIGSLCGLISSGIILSFNTTLAVSILVFLIGVFIFFIIKYFDNSIDHIKFSDIQKLKYITKENVLASIKDYTTKVLNKEELLEKAKGAKILFLKPMELKNKIDFNEIYLTTKDDIKNFFEIIFQAPYNYRLLIMGSILVLFGFWDTFVTSFLIDFLNGILESSKVPKLISAYVFIAMLAIPAYGAQIYLIGLAKKIGTLKILLPGILISGISVFMFGIFETFLLVLLLGLLNSLGYAAGMPTSQAEFSSEYNNTYAEKKNLKTIDSNASRAPLKMLLNLANVLGLFVGGIFVSIIGYAGTFFLFGFILIAIFVLSIKNMKEWKL
ncbi:MAG: MFS transporter [Candidatus Gracilibacteria bacterium]|nr:MFS transporter [Candidatus Gracilibacteria bacterium]